MGLKFLMIQKKDHFLSGTFLWHSTTANCSLVTGREEANCLACLQRLERDGVINEEDESAEVILVLFACTHIFFRPMWCKPQAVGLVSGVYCLSVFAVHYNRPHTNVQTYTFTCTCTHTPQTPMDHPLRVNNAEQPALCDLKTVSLKFIVCNYNSVLVSIYNYSRWKKHIQIGWSNSYKAVNMYSVVALTGE